MSVSVSHWLERISRGDEEARTWLWETFAERLRRRLRARYQERYGYNADELLQDAFVFYFQHDARALSRLLEVGESDGVLTEERLERHLWDLACGLASNRRRGLRRDPALGMPAGPIPSTAPNPERILTERDTLLRLAECIRARSERAYLYFKFRYVDGLTPEEIAAITGWSRKATYKLRERLNRAVAECAETLGLKRGSK